MLTGLLSALGAGLMWGLVFIAPTMLSDYPPAALAFGRYLAFGTISLVPAVLDRRRLFRLTRLDWSMAFKLSLVGNIVYYLALATAIQLAGTPMCAMIIGTLPIVISVCSNLAAHSHSASDANSDAGEARGKQSVAWLRLAPALICIAIGLLLVNWSETRTSQAAMEHRPYFVWGSLICLGALAAWTWYPIRNAAHLQAHPSISSSTWATAQGLTTLPLAMLGYVSFTAYMKLHGSAFDLPLGPRPIPFVTIMLAIGLLASWAGTLLWNKACQRLPTALSGQLIVFETLSALAYAFAWRHTWPGWAILAGAGFLCAGVSLGLRAFRHVERPLAH